MNIEIEYNPAIPLTSLKINNNPNDTIYGALYPVRRYPLQAWLNKNGAWKGLSKVLRDRTRGRRFTLTFIGRHIDFEDFKSSLVDINMELLHIPSHENTEQMKFIENILQELRLISDYPNKEFIGKKESLMESGTEAMINEYISPAQREALLDTIKKTRSLVLIDSKIFHDFAEAVQKNLYGNLNRPADSVAVSVSNGAEATKYSYLREYGISIVQARSRELDILFEKYSVPEAIGEEYRRLRSIAEFIGELLERKDLLRRLNDKIRDDFMESREDEYTQNADEIRWIRRNEAALIEIKDRILEKTEGL